MTRAFSPDDVIPLLVDPATVLIAVITGNRPRLEQRPTRLILDRLEAAGYTNVEWVVRENHAPDYETDHRPLNVYSNVFTTTYARDHWRHPKAKWAPDAFMGAFAGREHIVRDAARRGFKHVLQLDDNVLRINTALAGSRSENTVGATAVECVNVLLGMAASTNAAMCGMQLSALRPNTAKRIVRPGYPYSVFVETITPHRVPYYGPFEDDIMHALDYALSPSPMTAAVVPGLVYVKESKPTSGGMRSNYTVERGLGLVQHFPKNAVLMETSRTSSVMETERGIRHRLNTNGFTPVQVTDDALYDRSRDALLALTERTYRDITEHRRGKMRKRAGLEAEPV